MIAGRDWLAVGGGLSAAAVLHLGCIVGGPSWYRFFGAGEPMARAVERGSMVPHLLTMGIAGALGVAATSAFAGAGLIRPLPLLAIGLAVVTIVYLARGMFLFLPASAFGRVDLSPAFILWSSAIVLGFGLVHAIGLWFAWPLLRTKESF